jgi:hypothetical protein
VQILAARSVIHKVLVEQLVDYVLALLVDDLLEDPPLCCPWP